MKGSNYKIHKTTFPSLYLVIKRTEEGKTVRKKNFYETKEASHK